VIPEALAEFVCQMRDVLDVYQRPENQFRPVVCLDEVRRQLVRQGLTDKNEVQHIDYEYKRESVATSKKPVYYYVSSPFVNGLLF
jgi:hypothetical protein